MSVNTVKTQAHAIYRKLDAARRSEAVAQATRAGLLGNVTSSLRNQHPSPVPDRRRSRSRSPVPAAARRHGPRHADLRADCRQHGDDLPLVGARATGQLHRPAQRRRRRIERDQRGQRTSILTRGSTTHRASSPSVLGSQARTARTDSSSLAASARSNCSAACAISSHATRRPASRASPKVGDAAAVRAARWARSAEAALPQVAQPRRLQILLSHVWHRRAEPAGLRMQPSGHRPRSARPSAPGAGR